MAPAPAFNSNSRAADPPWPALPSCHAAVTPGESVTLTPSMMFFIGAAFADWLAEALGKPTHALSVSVRGARAAQHSMAHAQHSTAWRRRRRRLAVCGL